MHVYNMTADDITEVVNTTLCKDFNLKRPLAVGVLLWLGNRDRRFLFIKKASYSFGLRESYALKKEFERFQHTSAIEHMAFPGARYQTKTGSVPTSDLDPKSLSDLLEYYDGTLGDGDDNHTVAQAKKIAVDLLVALKAKQREKSQQLELSLAACSESSNLRVIAGDLASAGVGFRVVVGTSADAQKLAKARKLFAEVAQEPVTSRILRDGKYVFRPKSAGSAENPKKSCFGDLAEPMDLDTCIRYATTTLRIRKEVDAENYRRGNDGLRRKRAASKKATASAESSAAFTKGLAELRVLAHNALKSAGLVMDWSPYNIGFTNANMDAPNILFMADDSEATPSTAQLQVAPSEGRSVGWTCKIFVDRNEVFKTIVHPCKDGIEAVKHMLPETMKRIRAAIK